MPSLALQAALSLICVGVEGGRKQVRMKIKYAGTKTKVKSVQLGHLLKLPVFVIQKVVAPKNGVEFCQKSIGAISCSLATLYDEVRCREKSLESSWCMGGGCVNLF